MTEIKQIRLCGFGGQGIILAGTILGHAGINDGKWVAGSNSYGAAARGGTCRAEVVLSDKPITFPFVIKADILIAMSQDAYDKYIEDVKGDSGIVIYDEQMISPRDINGLKQIGISATDAAIKKVNNKQVANVVILGAAVEITKVVTRDALVAAIEGNVKQKFRESNLKAVNTGFKLGKMRGSHGSRRQNT